MEKAERYGSKICTFACRLPSMPGKGNFFTGF